MLAEFTHKYPELLKSTHRNATKLSLLINLIKSGIAGAEKDLVYSKIIKKLLALKSIDNAMPAIQSIASYSDDSIFLMRIAFLNYKFGLQICKTSRTLKSYQITRIIEYYKKHKQLFIHTLSKKHSIDETMTDYIIAKGNTKSIYTLLKNDSAYISEESLFEIFSNSLEDDCIFAIVLDRAKNLNSLLKKILLSFNTEIREKIINFLFSKQQTLQIFLPQYKSVQGFEYFIENNHAYKLKQDIDQLLRIKILSPVMIAKYLLTGDAYSFCYSISRITNTSFSTFSNMFCTNYLSETFAMILSKAGFDEKLSEAIINLTEFIYISSIEEYLTNQNFLSVIKKQYSLFISKYHYDKYRTIEYLFDLAHDTKFKQLLNQKLS